jgi:SAM-dependent methyltransferase
MTPAEYDAWYDSPRGRWIGSTELRLVCRRLRMTPGTSLLDVGCGTGGFTRRLARPALRSRGWGLPADIPPRLLRSVGADADGGGQPGRRP